MTDSTPAPRQAGRPKISPVGRRGRPSKTQIAQRDQQLLDRALDLFLEKGFDGTTIEAITESIAMSPRTIYARYRDKDALFRAALRNAASEWSVPVQQLRAVSTGAFDSALLRIAGLLVANQTSPSGLRLTRIANVEAFRRPEIGAYLWEQTAMPVLDFLSELFHARLLDHELAMPQAREAARSFMILVVSGAFHEIAWKQVSPSELDDMVESRTRLFLAGARAVYGGEPA